MSAAAMSSSWAKLTVEHVSGKQGKDGSEGRSHDRVCSNSRSCEHQIRVNDVVQQMDEDAIYAKPERDSGQCWYNPGNATGVAGPAEPEQSCRVISIFRSHYLHLPTYRL